MGSSQEPVLVVLPDSSVQMYDCREGGGPLTAGTVLREHPGHTLGKVPDPRKSKLEPSFALRSGCTYYLTRCPQSSASPSSRRPIPVIVLPSSQTAPAPPSPAVSQPPSWRSSSISSESTQSEHTGAPPEEEDRCVALSDREGAWGQGLSPCPAPFIVQSGQGAPHAHAHLVQSGGVSFPVHRLAEQPIPHLSSCPASDADAGAPPPDEACCSCRDPAQGALLRGPSLESLGRQQSLDFELLRSVGAGWGAPGLAPVGLPLGSALPLGSGLPLGCGPLVAADEVCQLLPWAAAQQQQQQQQQGHLLLQQQQQELNCLLHVDVDRSRHHCQSGQRSPTSQDSTPGRVPGSSPTGLPFDPAAPSSAADPAAPGRIHPPRILRTESCTSHTRPWHSEPKSVERVSNQILREVAELEERMSQETTQSTRQPKSGPPMSNNRSKQEGPPEGRSSNLLLVPSTTTLTPIKGGRSLQVGTRRSLGRLWKEQAEKVGRRFLRKPLSRTKTEADTEVGSQGNQGNADDFEIEYHDSGADQGWDWRPNSAMFYSSRHVLLGAPGMSNLATHKG